MLFRNSYRFALSALGLFFGLRLLWASQDILSLYQSWGFEAWTVRLAGLAQCLGAFLLWTKRFEVFGLFLFVAVLSSAVATHLRLEHEGLAFLPAAMMAFLVFMITLLKEEQRDAGGVQRLSPISGGPHSVSSGPLPDGFEEVAYEIDFACKASREKIVEILNNTRTFTRGQIFPYRVEFLDPTSGRITSDFKEGVFTNHHGPGLNAAGVLSEISGLDYRRLDYFYGSYAISFRLFRPQSLEMWFREDSAQKTHVRIRLKTFVRRGWSLIWRLGQNFFWPQFSWSIQWISRWR